MNIGIPKERRPFEYRVGLSPAGVEILRMFDHTVFVEHEAGLGAGFSDQEYEQAGARIVYSPEEVFGRADLLLKMARPLKEEMDWLQPGSIMAGFLHLASAQQDKIDLLLERKIASVAYEQIQEPDGSLPVLRPFSQIGGMMSAQIAARLLQNNWGGKGILLGGVPGVPPAEVVIIGGGVVGTNAARAFLGLGAHVTVLDISMQALQRISDQYPQVVTVMATKRNIERSTSFADVVIGAPLIPGQRTPMLVTREMVKGMKPRSLIIDVSIDQGGCVETSRPTSHDRSTYVDEGVQHYCVPNMPGVVARTGSHAFVNAVIPYILEFANKGLDEAIKTNAALSRALNTYKGKLKNLVRLTEGTEE